MTSDNTEILVVLLTVAGVSFGFGAVAGWMIAARQAWTDDLRRRDRTFRGDTNDQ